MLRVFIGFDPRQELGYQVCEASIRRHASVPVDTQPLVMSELRDRGLYWRPAERRGAQLWDVISDAPMSTEFALTRFLVPALCNFDGWALFVDADFMFRADVKRLFDYADEQYAVMCVQHHYEHGEGIKMDGQRQTAYARKNWSSLMLFNCGHPKIRERLTVETVNAWRGLDLHQMAWAGQYVGSLPHNWNKIEFEAAAVHFTHGMPNVSGYEDVPFADEWRELAAGLARSISTHCIVSDGGK